MRMYGRAGIPTLGWLVCACAALASERSDARVVSLDEVLKLARERAPAIAAARARVVQSEGRAMEGRLLPDPELSAGMDRARPADAPDGTEASFEVSQFVPLPWARRDRVRAGSAAIDAAQREVSAVVADVRLEAKRLYYEAEVDEAEARALEDAARDAHSILEVTERRLEVGEAAEGDRLRTRVEALRADQDARVARAEADAEREALNRFLLGALGSDFVLDTTLDPSLLGPLPADLLEQAVARNPDHQAAAARLESARWAAAAERSSRLPGITLSASQANELDQDSVGVGVALSIPLWNRNAASIRVAEGELAEAEAALLHARVSIEVEVSRLARIENAARESAVAYARDILPAAQEGLAITRFSFEQGEANLLAWLEARRSYLEILRASSRARSEAFIRRAEIERLVGDWNETSNQ